MSAPSQPTEQPSEQPWHAAFPSPVANLKDNSLCSISAEELHALILKEEGQSEKSYLVVDVRRTDVDDPVRALSFAFCWVTRTR
jgi:hypothetical protein